MRRSILPIMAIALLPLGMLTPAMASAYTGTVDTTVSELTVTATANITPKPNNYRIHWGDGARRPWAKSPTGSHTYAKAGTYKVVVDVAAGGVQYLAVASTTITVGASPTPKPEPAPTVSSLPYTADSFFKSTVAGAPINTARTDQFHAFMATHPDQKGISWPKINLSTDWAMSYDISTAEDPVWRLKGGNTGNAKLKILTTQGFHMSNEVANTFPTGNQDRPGVIRDTANGYTVQFADAVVDKTTRTITVSNAAIFYHSSNGLDYRNPLSNDQRNFSSRGRIPDAMVVTREDLDRAVAAGTGVGHVLHMFLVETSSADGYVHPMVGTESSKNGWGAEGERLRIKPSVDLVSRGLTGHALALARTLQENGTYIGDNSGSSTQIKLSQPQHYVGTNLTADVFKGKITWADFEVIQRGWQ